MGLCQYLSADLFWIRSFVYQTAPLSSSDARWKFTRPKTQICSQSYKMVAACRIVEVGLVLLGFAARRRTGHWRTLFWTPARSSNWQTADARVGVEFNPPWTLKRTRRWLCLDIQLWTALFWSCQTHTCLRQQRPFYKVSADTICSLAPMWLR